MLSRSLTGEVIDFEVLQFFFDNCERMAVDRVFKNRESVSLDLTGITHVWRPSYVVE